MNTLTAAYTTEPVSPSELSHVNDIIEPIAPCIPGELYLAIKDVLGAASFQRSDQTFSRRWVGQDTLNWGNIENWIISRLVQEMLASTCFGSWKFETDPAFMNLLGLLHKMRELMDLYSPQINPDVWQFMQNHPQVIDILLEAYPYLMISFGSAPTLSLRVIADPETNGEKELMAYIVTSLPVEEALQKLDQFDETWFLDQLGRFDCLFNFNLQLEA